MCRIIVNYKNKVNDGNKVDNTTDLSGKITYAWF